MKGRVEMEETNGINNYGPSTDYASYDASEVNENDGAEYNETQPARGRG